MTGAPSDQEVHAVEQELRTLKPGTQRALGGGVYLRLDGAGRRRYQFRGRAGRRQRGGTYDSWQEAHDARATLPVTPTRWPRAADASAASLRNLAIVDYARLAWWPTVLLECDALTQLDYKRGLTDLLPYVRGVTLAQLETSPLLIDRIRIEIAAAKTFPPGHRRAGELARAAADKPLKVLSIICGHAVERHVLVRNPMAGVRRFARRRSAAGDRAAPGHRRVLRNECKHPATIALVAAGMRGSPLELARRRLIPELIETGLRPSDICAMRHRWWRDNNGRLAHIRVDAAVKDLAGHLIEGEPKTGERELRLFDAIAERLELIFELQGSPGLDELVFPNRRGGLLDWGNWRQQVWYPALYRAGLGDGPAAGSPDAFWPYAARHAGITTMLHAQRPDGGTYSEREVARQFGNTVETLDRVYGDIPEDLHGIAGMTMDEILRAARRGVWGPMPGDPDYQVHGISLDEAALLTGISRAAFAGRLERGSLPGRRRDGGWYTSRFDLVWHGLLPR